MITNVTFQEIDNTTTCSANGYGDFTAMVATVQSGGTYPISVSVGNGFINESVSVWIDFDNTVNIDGLIGTDDFSSTNFTYYPNPMGDVLYIKANNDVESIAAYNVLGQHVLNNKNFADGKVDVSSLPAGTYLFRITFDSGQSENFTVLKK